MDLGIATPLLMTHMIGLANHKVEIILFVWLIACWIEQHLTTCHLKRSKINVDKIFCLIVCLFVCLFVCLLPKN